MAAFGPVNSNMDEVMRVQTTQDVVGCVPESRQITVAMCVDDTSCRQNSVSGGIEAVFIAAAGRQGELTRFTVFHNSTLFQAFPHRPRSGHRQVCISLRQSWGLYSVVWDS